MQNLRWPPQCKSKKWKPCQNVALKTHGVCIYNFICCKTLAAKITHYAVCNFQG